MDMLRLSTLGERHWQFRKYTTLSGSIDQSITNLVHALIGDIVYGTCIGGTMIEWCKGKGYVGSRFQPRAICKNQLLRLKEAERILERYVVDNNVVQLCG